MNLIDHVLNIRLLIHRALDGKFERLGIMPTGYEDRPSLSEEDLVLRNRLQNINDSHLAEKDDFSDARDYTLKQCVFTLFNRLAAIKLMEQKELFPEVIKQRAENGGFSAAHQAWLEEHPEGRSMDRDGIVPFLLDKFDEMVEMNFLIYQSDYPYAIMPTADELNEIIQAFNEIEDDPDCADTWRKDDILGWLYENFNTVEKVDFKDSGEKVEYDKVSLQSQVYTPSWVVKFLVDNTLGKLYLEMYPESDIDKADFDGNRKYSIANRPQTQQRRQKDLRKLKVLDPACGSGNFLLYTFSILYDLYVDQIDNFGAEYNRREIPSLIVENNLYGVDIDERAVQLSQIGLLIKARELGGRRAKMPKHTNVVCTNFELPTYDVVEKYFGYDASWEVKYNDVARKIWTDLADARKFGTLVRVEEQLKEIAPNDENHGLFSAEEMGDLFTESNKIKTVVHNLVNKYSEQNHNQYSLLKMSEAMAFLDLISNQFDVVVANPPYTDSGDFGFELKQFVEENYRRPFRFNSNLFACFIKRCCELADDEGRVGMIHPMTFMYIKTFEDVRKFILNETHIDLFVEYGLSNLFGSIMVDPAFYVLDMNKSGNNESCFISLDQYTRTPEEKNKPKYCLEALNDVIINKYNKHVYLLPQSKLKGIKSYPFIYWISDEFRDKFADEDLDHVLYIRQGLASGDNNRFLRFWWEVDSNTISETFGDNKKWIRYSKGGPYEKWYGNFWLTIAYDEENKALLANSGNHLPSRQFYFKEGVTYSAVGSKGITFRYLPENYLIDAKGPGVFPGKFKNIYYTLAFLNTKMIFYICNCLDPTVSINQGDIKRVPLAYPSAEEEILLEKLAKQNVSIKKGLCEYSLVDFLYKKSPIDLNIDVNTSIRNFYNTSNALLTLIIVNESIINHTVFDVYDLNEHDKQMVLEKEGDLVGDLPVSNEAKSAYLRWLKEVSEFKPLSEVLNHIVGLEECEELPPITDFDTLYQNNNEWEEFCIKRNVNPIEAWYQFNTANILPPQRTQVLAFELIADVIRSLLAKDDDGVIPLTNNSGETNLAPRIEAEMVERGYGAAQIAQVFTLLGGGNLQNYLQNNFFQQLSDHLNLFMYLPKTPFIWHITSGVHHALELYVSIYKWKRDTLIRIKSVYAANREAALNDRLQVLMQGDATQKAEAAEVRAQLKELSEFCDKIDELLASGYDPKLDDGVGKNIAPLQKAGIISYEVLNKKQLEKYLNADW